MVTLKLRKIGNSQGVILPKEVLADLGLSEGGQILLTNSPDGYKLTTFDPEFEAKMSLAEEGMAKYKNALRELAK